MPDSGNMHEILTKNPIWFDLIEKALARMHFPRCLTFINVQIVEISNAHI